MEEEADELNDNASMEKYEAFLNGQEKVGISKVDLNSYMYEGMELTIDQVLIVSNMHMWIWEKMVRWS